MGSDARHRGEYHLVDELEELIEGMQVFLNQENELSNFEMYFELDCPLCAEDGFRECQGHPYSNETGYLER